MNFNTTEELIQELRAGRMIVLADDEARENEGDLVVAASLVTPEHINFMTRHGRGLLCLAMTRERCQQLNLPLMDPTTDEAHRTNFTFTIDAHEGITTGVSAHDRATTIQAAVSADARPGDILQPGHLQCLMQQPGGVLTRAGHTEGGCDLARLAGLEPAAVIVEILNEDGTMARRPQLEGLAEEHGLKIGTIENLIRYRAEREPTVRRGASCHLPTDYGEFELIAYEDLTVDTVHLALVAGPLDPQKATLVRVHVQNTLSDVTLASVPDLGWPLRDALQRIAAEGQGVAVILRWPESPPRLLERVRMLHNSPEPARARAVPTDRRVLGAGSQILADLGIRQMRLMSAPQVFHGLGGFGLEVVEHVEQ